MPRYRYECLITATGTVEAENASQAEDRACTSAAIRAYDADPSTTWDVTVTELSEGDNQ